MNLARRLAGFSTLPFLAAVLPVIALPFVSRAASADDWAALNIGLGVGAFAAAAGLVGWNILGTPLVAMSATADEQRALYSRSFFIRAGAVLIATTIGGIVAAIISPAGSWEVAAVFAAAGAVNGIGLSWYAVGVSAPRLVLWYELLPRAIATVTAVPLVLWVQDVFWYGLLLWVAVIAGTLAFHIREFGRVLPQWPGLAALRADVKDMRAAWGIESTGSLYQNAPVPLTGWLSSAADAGAFASSDRIYRYGTLAVVAAGNALQGWVLETDGEARAGRNRVAFLIMGAVGAIGWVVLAILGPWVSGWIFGLDKQGDPIVFHFFAVAFVAISLSTPLTRNILIPARYDRALLVITLCSAIIGVTAMVTLGTLIGTVGVAIGFAASETITFVSCLVLALRIHRHRARASARTAPARS